MTGYGASRYADDQVEVSIDLKALNSKFLDINIRTGRSFTDKEMEIRNLITEHLQRGKVTLNIDFQKVGSTEPSQEYNRKLFGSYYRELQKLADEVGSDESAELFRLAFQSPEVVITKSSGNTEEDWQIVHKALVDAIKDCDSFRVAEGASLKSKIIEYIDNIRQGLQEVIRLDPTRVEKVRSRLSTDIERFIEEEKIDKNRLEQELFYYIEKLDINEETVRLNKHLDYFIEMANSANSNGKKLGFIAQEIGREINTIGSKAQDAEMQKSVVLMKEELEKIKEQVLNIL